MASETQESRCSFQGQRVMRTPEEWGRGRDARGRGRTWAGGATPGPAAARTPGRVPGVLWFFTPSPGGLEQQGLLPHVGTELGAPHPSWLRRTWVSLVRANGSGVKEAWEQEAKQNSRCVRHLPATAEHRAAAPCAGTLVGKGKGSSLPMDLPGRILLQGKEGARGVFPSRAGAWEGNHPSQSLPSAYGP